MRIIDAERWISELEAQMDAEGCPWEIQEYNLMLINEIQARLDCIDEESENKGKLLKLPCAVGDTVYTNVSMKGWYFRKENRPYEAKVVFVGVNGFDNFMNVDFRNGRMLQFKFLDIGKTVFLTKEEAEAALKNM